MACRWYQGAGAGRAAAAVEQADLPADLRPVAFGALLEAMLAPARADTPAPAPTPDEPAPSSSPSHPDARELLARRSGVPEDRWPTLVSETGARVELLVSRARLPAGAKAATRDVVLLVGAARQGLGLDDFTSLDHVRDELRRYGRYSTGHFREYIDALDDVITIRASDRSYRLLPDGWEHLPDVAERLVAG